ncbi:MAG: hypothetical protein AB8F94_12230 [Saprospiraceae bacterium]
MITEFEIAIEELYKIFSKYPLKSKIEGCPCCVKEADKTSLHSKKLRELEDEDLSYYAFKAMTTFGDLEDFKYFLPRIFELSAKRKLIVDTFVVLGKLEYGDWLNWDQEEKNIINKFIHAWWKYDINNHEYFDTEILIELSKLIKDLSEMLDCWNLDIETQGFKNYVDLIESHYHDLKNKNREFKEIKGRELEIFTSWIEANSYKLEEGFFRFENEDKEFSDRISDLLFFFE